MPDKLLDHIKHPISPIKSKATMPFSLPGIKDVPQLNHSDKVKVLDNLFEPCPTLTAILTAKLFNGQQYTSYKDLIETSRVELLKYLDESEQAKGQIRPEIPEIISAHPRLGPAKPNTGALSDHSSSEQKSLQGTKEEAEKLVALNDKYETTFPGLRYVVFVNGRSREVIMNNMTERINRNDIVAERKEAFNAMCDIALDRAKKLGAKL